MLTDNFIKNAIIMLMAVFTFAPITTLQAAVAAKPADLQEIINKISRREKLATDPSKPNRWASIEATDKLISFKSQGGIVASTVFVIDQNTITKIMSVKESDNDYRWQITLTGEHQPYQWLIVNINNREALVFYNDDDVFVYTQEITAEGLVSLKEWIYVRHPNSAKGSQWQWVYKSLPWQWPMTLDLKEDGQATMIRHVPFSGIPITQQARYNYMLQMMIKYKSNETVDKYYPYKETVGEVSRPMYWNKEGVQIPTQVRIDNRTQIDPTKPRPKHGLDFARWDDHFQTFYTVSVDANPKDYPLLIE